MIRRPTQRKADCAGDTTFKDGPTQSFSEQKLCTASPAAQMDHSINAQQWKGGG
jgi:hypothetical protein